MYDETAQLASNGILTNTSEAAILGKDQKYQMS